MSTGHISCEAVNVARIHAVSGRYVTIYIVPSEAPQASIQAATPRSSTLSRNLTLDAGYILSKISNTLQPKRMNQFEIMYVHFYGDEGPSQGLHPPTFTAVLKPA
jgi:hypothetical protein